VHLRGREATGTGNKRKKKKDVPHGHRRRKNNGNAVNLTVRHYRILRKRGGPLQAKTEREKVQRDKEQNSTQKVKPHPGGKEKSADGEKRSARGVLGRDCERALG